MYTFIRSGFSCLLILPLLTSCMFLAPEKGKIGNCRTLKSKIIFSGATTNDRQATLENAETPLDQHLYDIECT